MIITNEIWKDVSAYEGIYQISNHGRLLSLVKSIRNKPCKRKKPKILKQHLNKTTGYYGYVMGQWGLYKDKRFSIHRLVALAFIPNPANLPEVNHKDGNKLNNQVENLEWVSRETNIQHAYDTGLIRKRKGEECSNVKLTEETVRKIFISEAGPRKLSRILKLPYSTVNAIKNGANWNHVTGLPKPKWKQNDCDTFSNRS